jgi:hypothetical protein
MACPTDQGPHLVHLLEPGGRPGQSYITTTPIYAAPPGGAIPMPMPLSATGHGLSYPYVTQHTQGVPVGLNVGVGVGVGVMPPSRERSMSDVGAGGGGGQWVAVTDEDLLSAVGMMPGVGLQRGVVPGWPMVGKIMNGQSSASAQLKPLHLDDSGAGRGMGLADPVAAKRAELVESPTTRMQFKVRLP